MLFVTEMNQYHCIWFLTEVQTLQHVAHNDLWMQIQLHSLSTGIYVSSLLWYGDITELEVITEDAYDFTILIGHNLICQDPWLVEQSFGMMEGVHDIYGMVFVGDRIWLSGCPGNLNSTT